MKCLILAAGEGRRIADLIDSKPLLPLAGLTLIQRTIASAFRAGLTDLYVVTGYNAGRVEEFLADLRLPPNVSVRALRNDRWQQGNGTSVLRGREVIDEDFVLMMADHVFDEAILKRLINEPLNDDGLILASDYRIQDNRLITLDDVTKVQTDDHRIIDIGKDLKDYSAYDTGIFLCSTAIFTALEAAGAEGDHSLSGGVRRLARQGVARTLDIGNRFWMDVDTVADLKKARWLLYNSLIKPHDGLVSRAINRKISLRIFTPLLLRFFGRITANQVSVISFVVALAGGVCFFLRHPVIGGLVVQLASILDGCDGEIARLKKIESRFGHFLDGVFDRYADSFILFGMLFYAWTAPLGLDLFGGFREPLLVVTAFLAVCGHLMVSYTSAKSVADFGYRYRGRWIAAGRGRDWRLLLLCLGGVFAVVDPISVFLALAVVAVATNCIVLRRLVVSFRLAQTSRPFVDGRIKAIVFDLDGTIADTMGFLTDLAVQLMTQHYDLAEDEARRRYLETTGLDFASQMELIFPGHMKNREVIEEFEARKQQQVLGYPIFPDVRAALSFFKQNHITCCICSSTTPGIVSEYVKKHKIDDLLADFRGYKNGFTKDKQIEVMARTLQLSPDEVLFVGDSLTDPDFAKGAKTRFVGICRIFKAKAFAQLGVMSVEDLTALVRWWSRSADLLGQVQNVP